MKALVLAVCTALLLSCDSPPQEPATASPDKTMQEALVGYHQAKGEPGQLLFERDEAQWSPAGDVQAIQQAFTVNAAMIVKARIKYNTSWDAVLRSGSGVGVMAHVQVYPVADLICPRLWLLVCHDQPCSAGNVEAQYYNVPASAVSIKAMSHYPGSLQYDYCQYEIRNNGASGGGGIPVQNGRNWVWYGYNCPGNQFASGGATGLGNGTVDYFGTGTFSADFGQSPGPYGDKLRYRSVVNGCYGWGPDFQWYETTPLDMQWCLITWPDTTCNPANRHTLSSSW